MICPVCKLEVIDNKRIVALDRPKRVNIYFHRECLQQLSENVEKFISDNYSEIIKSCDEIKGK